MTGSATVGNYPLPAVYNVIGGGSYCAGGTGVNVGLNGSNSGITYQLFNGPDTIGFPISGTGTLLNFGLQTATGTYTVIATNSTTTCTNYMDSSAMVSVNPVVTPSVTITSSASGDTACAGSMLTLTALPSNGGSAPTYQWMVNGLGAGAGGSYSYIPANGDVVTVQLTSSNACAMPDTASNTVTLNVIPQETPTIAISAVPGNVVCSGTTVDFTTAATSGGTSPEYMWKKNGFPIAGATGALYSYVPANGDVITCLLTSNYQCRLANSVLSNAISVEVDSPVVPVTVISANPSNYLVKGETVTFTATITNTVQSPTYQWYVDGLFVPGAVLPTYTDNGFTDLQTVRCVVTSGGGCAGLMDTSNVIIVHISTTGVQQVTAAGGDIQLVPNPNKGIFTLKGNLGIATDEAVSLEITDMLGQVIYNDKLMAHNGELNEKITLSNTLANGMYILSLRSANGNKVFHMVIEQ